MPCWSLRLSLSFLNDEPIHTNGTGFAIGSPVTMPEMGRATMLYHWILAVQRPQYYDYLYKNTYIGKYYLLCP